jgi:glycosyltransferase involved in cell wall biosynthesis
MRVCVVYDCIFPWTVGGAERWYRSLSERLAAAGHDVTYITLRQWDRKDEPQVPGVRVVAAGPRMALYTGGRRRILPPLVFGAGVLWHLLRAGRRYDAVHTASFPYFSLLAARLVRRLHGFSLVVDWHEFWTRGYWREYLGAAGRIGWWIQQLCVRTPQRAFCFARVTARRLREEGLRGEISVLEGEYAGPLEPRPPRPAEPRVVFAGRHIPEKRVPALIPAFALARRRLGDLRCEIYGDGPDRPAVLRLIEQHRLGHAVHAPGFVPSEEVEQALSRALCMVLPSRREGYGLIVVEASAYGTPSVVVDEEDNAAVELVTDGENGVVAASASPDDLAEAVLRVHEAGPVIRESTANWFARNSRRLSLDSSLAAVLESYAAGLDAS